MEVRAVDELERIEMAARREAGLGPGDVEADDALVAVADGQLGDLHRSRELAHRGDDGADRRSAARRLPTPGRHARSPPSQASHDVVERQAALGGQLRRVADLGVDDAVGGEVLGTFGGDSLDRVGRLHHADGVAEALEVQLEGLAVGAGAEPALERVDVLGRAGPRSRRSRASSMTVAGRRPPSR